jgi:hypothetical protein
MLIDLGGNLLPAFAEGSGDVKACAERLAVLEKAGIAAAVLTPRYYPAKRSVEDFLEFRERVLHSLSYNMPEKCPALYLGCEVYVDERLKYISTIGELTVLGTRTMIAYMPEGEWEGALIDTLEAIRAVGIEVLVAHIDRYPDKYAEDLFKCGYRAIIDASAFVGMANLRRRKKFLSWIDEGNIVGIGGNFDSDEKRVGEIIAKVNDLLGEERARKLAESSARILAGAVNITK